MQLKVPIRIRGDKSRTGLEAERVFNITEWFILASRFESAMRVVIARALEKYELTAIEWMILEAVSEVDDGRYNVSKLAQMFDLNVPQTTVLISGMARKNLLRTKPDTKDRRIKNVICTRNGRKVAFEAGENIQHAMRYWLFDLNDSEIETYQKTLKKITRFELPSKLS